MFEFILGNIAMVSAGVVLYLFAHSLPRIGEPEAQSKDIFERWATSEFPEKLDGAFNGFAGKFLRKLRVVILRFDNIISESLRRFKQNNGNGKSLGVFEKFNTEIEQKRNVDFKETIEDKEGGSDGKSKKKKHL
ncbi:MAG: hypothetical protein NUV53_00405 [Patescibacteria group bacterium]|nr:hypothetical protein [Patescibacteria group bacterium]